MNYKSVIEEQIRELQKLQDKTNGNIGCEHTSCIIAETIANLCEKARMLSYNNTKEKEGKNVDCPQ